MSMARKAAIVLVLAFVGWALCAAIIGLGIAVTSQTNAFIAHGIGAPVVFALISALLQEVPVYDANSDGCDLSRIRDPDGFLRRSYDDHEEF